MTRSTPRSAAILVHGKRAGTLTELGGGAFIVQYKPGYAGAPISLTLPVRPEPYPFERFPAFFDGLLPEGWQLEALLRAEKFDATDYMGQLLAVGQDTVGAVTVEPLP
ncbi:MAG: serine/threonine-protein kinase HipA [Thalassolituus oleivorans]|jgi:serine/threonine-protein kinase HipA